MFSLSKEQEKKLAGWQLVQEAKVISLEKGTELEHSDEAYYGAVGGGYTYSFTPTSLGCITKVENNITKEEIDLTEYDQW